MKKFLVLTDFTENSLHAARSVITLCAKLNANVLLYHAYAVDPVTPYFGGGPWIADEFSFLEGEGKEKLHELAANLEPIIDILDSELHKPVVTQAQGPGDVAGNLTEIFKNKDIEMVIMGARSGGVIDHLFTGCQTNAVIDKSTRPVLVVPQHTNLDQLKKVVFATDFNEADIAAIHYLAKIARILNLHIEVVHVDLGGSGDAREYKREEFLEWMNRLRYPEIIFKEIKGRDVVHRLNTLCEETNADLLAMVHYQHSFFKRAIEKSTVKIELAHQHIPVLIFPSKMKDKL
eukprot:gnl/Spiro4/3437_TR1676_c0_g1_i1.p1 gnl/Spiro4/3437_TR1676_c0_g1~~gnl/Spiro4/3437_TR1676_c0_g1_i1.p1  ORF type:complete len:290 (-),score=-41.23 gnl/Spiro4/3437_TR1676_c0_g1_i1:134-1003(-)